jgi:glyoxylase I family protein
LRLLAQNLDMPQLIGFSHLDLTVSDRERAAAWWREVLGFTLVNRHRGQTSDANSMIHPSGIAVTLMTHDDAPAPDTFDERRIGLDHLAFQVTDSDELQRWVAHLDSKGVPNTGIIDSGYGPTLVFRDPDNIQLEFYVHQNPADMTHLTDADSAEAQAILGTP